MKKVIQSQSEAKIPQFLQPFLWSYDLSQLDLTKHKNIIIKNILDLGTSQATDWLKQQYSEDEIRETIRESVFSDWSKKSINLWTLVYNISPKKTRF